MRRNKNEQDRIAIWRERIRLSKEMRDDESKVWDKTVAAYRGKLRPSNNNWNPQDPWVGVAKVFSSIRAAIPTLLYSNPKFTITPTRPIIENGVDISWERARMQEMWLNHVWRETDANKHIRVAILSAFLAYGAVKVGYAPAFADDEMRGEFDIDDEGQLRLTGVDPKTGNEIPALKKGEFDRDDNGDLIWDEDTGLPLLHPGTIQREEFFVEWCDFNGLLHDPEGGNVFRNHCYIIEEWVRPIEDVRYDPRFRPSVRREIKATAHLGAKPNDERQGLTLQALEDADPRSSSAAGKDCQRVRGYDIYDFRENRYMVLAHSTDSTRDSNDRFLLDEPLSAAPERGPYRFLKFNEDVGRWYPIPDAEPMARVEQEYNITRSQIMRRGNQNRQVWLHTKGAFSAIEGSQHEKEKFVSGPDGVLVEVADLNGIASAPPAQFPSIEFAELPAIINDFNDVAGQPGEARGIADADTATQASILQAGSDVRNNDRRDNQVQTFLSEIGRALLQSGQQLATLPIFVKIPRDRDDPIPFDFQQINPQDLKGEFDVEVVIGSTAPKNSSYRIQLYERIMTLIGQFPVLGTMPRLMRRVLEAIDLKDDAMIAEIQQKTQEAMDAQNAPQGGSAPGGTQTLEDQLLNQFTNGPNVAGGSGTGAPPN